MNLTAAQIDALRKIASQPASEPMLWGLNLKTVAALHKRGLVRVETARYSGHYNRFGMSTSANRARLTYHVEAGAALTDAGRAAVASFAA